MDFMRYFLISTFSLLLSTMSVQAQSNKIRFDRDIKPILSDRCFHCHGPDHEHREADLRLDQKEAAFADRDGSFALVPGSLEKSAIWERISSHDESVKMPPPESNKKLTVKEIDLFKRWIEEGAEWSDHWSFVTPVKPDPPQVSNDVPAKNPIDQFIGQKLLKNGKQFEAGHYKPTPDTNLYVNRGIGMEGGRAPRVRFWCPPEVSLIELVQKDTATTRQA